jgi:phosphomannomutase
MAIPQLLLALGVKDVKVINSEMNGEFQHNPEPLEQNLSEIKKVVLAEGADLGIVVDPDVDRLAFIDEKGEMFGEEYTLVAIADYVLRNYCACFYQKISVSNLSSSRALKDITEAKGGSYYATAVGELNVVAKMKEKGAVIGGEGNGGIIVPDLHYGRDALIGIALFLTQLSKQSKSVKQLRSSYPDYIISKNKIELTKDVDLNKIFEHIKNKYKKNPINTDDGLKIEFDKDWVHLRSSNTEPIIRIYAESESETVAANIAKRLMADIQEASGL